MGHSDLKSFLAKKEAIQKEFEEAILTALIELGEGIHGVDWFSASARDAVEERAAA